MNTRNDEAPETEDTDGLDFPIPTDADDSDGDDEQEAKDD